MEIIERIYNLIDINNTNANRVTKGCGLNSNIFTFWKNGRQKPSLDALIKIADYFNVSIDYLVGRETSTAAVQPQQNITNDATTSPLFNRFAKLDKSQQDKVMAYIDGLEDAENTTTKQLFNQGRMEERERELEEENMQQQKKYI